MVHDGVHGVPGLLSGDAEVLLKRTRDAREDGLRRLVHVQRGAWG